MTYEEFVNRRISIQPEEMEPFCPFGVGYCDNAYSDKCYGCEDSWFEYKEMETKEDGYAG